MRKFLAAFFTTLFAFSIGFAALPAQARSYRTRSSDVRVHGYYRSNGTYVRPYFRTRADHTKLNNYSCIDYGRC